MPTTVHAVDMLLMTEPKSMARFRLAEGKIVVLITSGTPNRVICLEPGDYELSAEHLKPDAGLLGIVIVDERHAEAFANMPVEMSDGILRDAVEVGRVDLTGKPGLH